MAWLQNQNLLGVGGIVLSPASHVNNIGVESNPWSFFIDFNDISGAHGGQA